MSGWLTNGMNTATLPLGGLGEFPVDTQNTQGALPETNAVSLSQLFQYTGGGASVPWVTGRFYSVAPGTTPVAVTPTSGLQYAYPLYIPATTIKTLSISVTTGQTGGVAHYGIYADTGAGAPGNLVYDFGASTIASTATVTVTSTASALALQSGLYWISSIFSASSTLSSVIGLTSAYTNVLPYQMGFDTAAHAVATSGQAATGIFGAGSYGALPSTFPTSVSLTLGSATPMACFGV